MEGGVHFPCQWESELIESRKKDFLDFKGTLVFGDKFPRGVVELEVFVIQLDLISHFPGCKAGINAFLHKKDNFFMGGDGFFPCLEEEVQAFF